MDRLALKRYRLQQRRKRVRKKINGSAVVPRISVYKSNRHFYLQAIDDQAGVTLTSSGTYEIARKGDGALPKNRVEVAKVIGEELARRLLKKNVARAVYDCNGNKYHGTIRVIADSIRAAGVQV